MCIIQMASRSGYYGSLAAVQDLSLTVEQGELLGFADPNGAGKTTTIRMIIGLLRPTAGTANITRGGIMTQRNRFLEVDQQMVGDC